MEIPAGDVGEMKAVPVEVSSHGKKIWKAIKALGLWFIRWVAISVLLGAFRAFMQHKLDDITWWGWIVLAVAWSVAYSWIREGLIKLIREAMKPE